MRDGALRIADRFDARNGSSACSDQVRGVLAAEPLATDLPLDGASHAGPLGPRTATNASPSSAGTAPATAGGIAESPRPPTGEPGPTEPGPGEPGPTEPAPGEPATPGRLLDEAEELWRRRRITDAEPQLRRFDELTAEEEVSPLMEARRADLRGAELVTSGDPAGGGALWERAIRLYGEAGDEERRQQALGRLGALRCQESVTAEQGIALIEESTEHLWESPSVPVRAAAALRLARSYLMVGRGADAREIAEQATVLAEQSGYAIDRADALFVRAQVLAEDDQRLQDARGLAESARGGYRDHDHTSAMWACLLHGQLLWRTSAPTHAIEDAWREAIDMAGADSALRARAHAVRGHWRLETGQATEAVIDLTEAYAAFTLGVHDAEAATVSVDLSRAYLVAEQPADAAEIAEEALPKLLAASGGDRAGMLRVIATARVVLAGALAQMGEREGAATQFEHLAELQGEVGDLAASGTWGEAAAEMWEQDDRDAEAGHAFGRAAACFSQVADLLSEARCRRREALSVGWRGEVQQALQLLGVARHRLASLPTEQHRLPRVLHETGWLCYAEARMLASVERQPEAVDRADDAVARMHALVAALRQDGAPDDLEEAEGSVRMVTQWRDALRADLSSI